MKKKKPTENENEQKPIEKKRGNIVKSVSENE